MDGDSDSGSGESGDHSPPEIGGPVKERAMDGPFFMTALVLAIVLIAIVFFIR